jgi:hypothetical protein
LATGAKSGYNYTYNMLATDASGNVLSYSLNADPIQPGQTGDKHFYTDQTCVIHYTLAGSAGPSDPPLQ